MKKKIHKINKSSNKGLSDCSDEPIHLIGTIQAFSIILGFDLKSQELIFFSERAQELLNKSLFNDKFSWRTLKDLIKSDHFSQQNWKLLSESGKQQERTLSIDNINYVVNFFVTDRFVITEFEKVELELDNSLYERTASFVNDTNMSGTFTDFASSFSRLIKTITGYDRVMVYQFDENYNGHVIAESKEIELDSFLDLHYPHTDIPKQARELYKNQWIRMLCDVSEMDQSIISKEAKLDAAAIDLGQCNARSVSPIHIEYLKNMGVTGTLTLSIMIDRQLWGLVACHHYSPKQLDFFRRKEALLFTQLFGAQIKKWEAAEEYAQVQEKEHIYQSILEEVIKSNDKFEAATSTSYFIGITESDGGAVIRGEEVYCFGTTPEKETILKIHKWMRERNEQVFLTNEFSKHTGLGKEIKKNASGVLYYSFDDESHSAMIWFRKERSTGIKWGGRNTDKVDSSILSPRKSFEAWEEEVDGKSAHWKSHQIQAGLRLGAYLEKEVFIGNLKKQKQQLEHLADQLKSKNEELSQFNWISSHDMKEPLRKIRMFIDQIRLEEENLSDSQQEYFQRLESAATRMQNLIGDLLNYSKLSKEEAFREVSLNTILLELKQHFNDGDVKIHWEIEEFPRLEIVPFQIKQLFSNLIGNSIKFRKENKDVEIKITKGKTEEGDIGKFHLVPGLTYVKLVYEDNGIGFDNEYNDKIFEVFQRLHSQKKYEGTGIGLAICKKIVESHHGEIFAQGNNGNREGARFTLILPLQQPD